MTDKFNYHIRLNIKNILKWSRPITFFVILLFLIVKKVTKHVNNNELIDHFLLYQGYNHEERHYYVLSYTKFANDSSPRTRLKLITLVVKGTDGINMYNCNTITPNKTPTGRQCPTNMCHRQIALSYSVYLYLSYWLRYIYNNKTSKNRH